MAKMSRTWWGQHFLSALEGCMDAGRLSRGRSYASDRRLLQFEIKGISVSAEVRGNKNPYFGVYKEPQYQVAIRLTEIPKNQWDVVLGRLSKNAAWLTKLMLNEMPEDIEDAFEGSNHRLLPSHKKHLNTTCSCPDYANPCKHIAGVFFRLASQLDRDPLLLFQLRGLDLKVLKKSLSKSPLGRAMTEQLNAEAIRPPTGKKNRYTPVPSATDNGSLSHRDFWTGHSLPKMDSKDRAPSLPAIVLKKEGDYPAFWESDKSFLKTMEDCYAQVLKTHRDIL